MLTETVKVLSIDSEHIWLAAQNKTSCSACSAQSVCGHSLLSKLHPVRKNQINIPNKELNEPSEHDKFSAKVGDNITIGIEETLLLRLALSFYLLPLLSMIAVMASMHWLGFGEVMLIPSAVAGLAIGLFGSKTFIDQGKFKREYQVSVLANFNESKKNA